MNCEKVKKSSQLIIVGRWRTKHIRTANGYFLRGAERGTTDSVRRGERSGRVITPAETRPRSREQHGRERAATVPGLGEVLEHFTELFLADGFHEISIGAQRVRLVNVGLLFAQSENDDRQVLERRIVADPTEDFQSAE